MEAQVSGFTIVRNAQKLDYPFVESVLSALPLCREFIINCGDSEDETKELCSDLQKNFPDKVRVIDSVWNRDAQSGGFQLKHQSDLALAECKQPWCLYIQADEVLHEDDYVKLARAMGEADHRPEIDGILSDYLHFYGNYSYQIRGRNWYRREVRLFKNFRGIEAFRDAQGFRRGGKRLAVLRSGSRMFHYGYVRTSASLGIKSAEMSQWWGEAPVTDPGALQLRRHVGLRKFQQTHPAVMANRIARNDLCFDPTRCARTWDRNELKNALTLLWESVFPIRIGEFRNYEVFTGRKKATP